MIMLGLDVMAMSDQLALSWIKTKIDKNGEAHITYCDMSMSLGCHKNTAWNICRRLRSAGQIEIVGGSRRNGFIYKIND